MTKTEHFQLVSSLRGDDASDTKLLISMAHEAKRYIESFHWASNIKKQYLAYCIAEVVAIFWIEFSEKIAHTDDALWVIVGDLPSAYLVSDAGETPKDVLKTYCQLMSDWSENVILNGDPGEVFPVRADRNMKNAHLLQGRVQFLQEEIIPTM